MCVYLAHRLQLGPWVSSTDFHGWLVVEDVVTEILQWRLGVRGGKLGRLLDLLPDLHVDFLQETEDSALHVGSSAHWLPIARID